MHTIPLATIRDELMGRWWARFSMMGGFLQEQAMVHHYHLLVPADAHDTLVVADNVHYLREVYPRSPHWYNLHRFPAAIACPLPLVTFYFHTLIRSADTQAEKRFWDNLMQMEVALLFATAWYNQAVNGRRGFVLRGDTVQWLRQRLGDRPIAVGRAADTPGVRFSEVAGLMDAVNATDERRHNLVRLTHHGVPDCYNV